MDWLYLHLPQLQLDQLMLGTQPACVFDEAVIVVDPATRQLCQLNPAALAQGLKPGMRLDTARALCHPLHVIEKKGEEGRALGDLARTLYPISADIALFSEPGLLCKVTPMLRLYGSLTNYLAAISTWVAQQQITVHSALAETPVAAKTLAEAGLDTRQQTAVQVKQLLRQLPLRALALSNHTHQQLERLGLRRIGDIQDLPRAEIRLRLGAELMNLLDQLFGKQQTQLHFFEPETYFSQHLDFGHEVSHSLALLFPLKKLLQQLQQYLQSAARSTNTLTVKFSLRDSDDQTITLHSAAPERSAECWLALAQLKLEALKLTKPVIGLGLSCTQLLELEAPATDLFATRRPTLSAAQLISRLQARLGEDRVQNLQLQADHRPEHAFIERPAALTKSAPLSPVPPLLRPSLLLDTPQPLAETVRIVHGPERIQSAWWTEQPICRDYFVAHNTAQQTLWVFRDQAQCWFVHGWFA